MSKEAVVSLWVFQGMVVLDSVWTGGSGPVQLLPQARSITRREETMAHRSATRRRSSSDVLQRIPACRRRLLYACDGGGRGRGIFIGTAEVVTAPTDPRRSTYVRSSGSNDGRRAPRRVRHSIYTPRLWAAREAMESQRAWSRMFGSGQGRPQQVLAPECMSPNMEPQPFACSFR